MANLIKSKSETNKISLEKIDMTINIRETLNRYEIAPTVPFKKSPLEYWKMRSSSSEKSWVVEMSNVAKIYLSPPPSSCDVERLFSTASEILNRRRNRLLAENAEKLLFVHENIANVNYKW